MKKEKHELAYKKLILANEAALYVLPMPWVKTVGLGVHVNVGTRDESWPKEAGLAHAMEHMVFQGTEKFAGSKETSEYLESVGGKLNAFTWNEFTCFFNCLPSEEKIRGVEVLSQQLRKPLFLSKKIKTEMENIVEEIDRSHDDPHLFIEDEFFAVLCGEHPLGRRTLGTKESIRAFKKKDFQNWQRKFFHPGNFTYVAVGNTKPKEAKLYFEEYFPEKASKPNIRKAELISQIPKDATVQKELEQAHVMLGTIIPGRGQREALVLSLFRVMISGGMSFPLYQEVRDKKGLCYEIWADIHPLSDNGIFNIYIGTSPNKIEEATGCITEVIQKSRTSQELLEKAKKSIKGKLAFKFESTGSILQSALFDIIYRGKPRGYEEILEEMESITIEEVEAAVDRYLAGKILKVALIPKT